MVSIAADNREVERCLQKIVALTRSGGAEYADELLLKSVDGYLSVEAPPSSAGKVLMRVPWDRLVPLPPFRLSIVDDDIVISSHEAELTSEAVALMEALLELYNATKNIARYRRATPLTLMLSHPQLLQHVRRGRRHHDPLTHQRLLASNEDDVILESFLQSRMFDYKDLNLILPYPVLMPIIDLVNHDFRGAAYFFEDEPGRDRFLAIKRSVPVPGNENESFARYGAYDAFDTWMSYGFIDESASFVSSVAATLDLPGLGTIRLGTSLKPRALKDLPRSVGDLQLYIPQLIARRGSNIEVAALAIPGPQAPRALRRALHFLIMEMSAGRANRRDLVLQAEEQIIAANRAYYRDLLAFLRSLSPIDPRHEPIRDNFVRVCDLQLARIEDYVAVAEG
jgi:hypothetical protein